MIFLNFLNIFVFVFPENNNANNMCLALIYSTYIKFFAHRIYDDPIRDILSFFPSLEMRKLRYEII